MINPRVESLRDFKVGKPNAVQWDYITPNSPFDKKVKIMGWAFLVCF